MLVRGQMGGTDRWRQAWPLGPRIQSSYDVRLGFAEPAVFSTEDMNYIIDLLFPIHPRLTSIEPLVEEKESESPVFKEIELLRSVPSMKNKNAPGLQQNCQMFVGKQVLKLYSNNIIL